MHISSAKLTETAQKYFDKQVIIRIWQIYPDLI